MTFDIIFIVMEIYIPTYIVFPLADLHIIENWTIGTSSLLMKCMQKLV